MSTRFIPWIPRRGRTDCMDYPFSLGPSGLPLVDGAPSYGIVSVRLAGPTGHPAYFYWDPHALSFQRVCTGATHPRDERKEFNERAMHGSWIDSYPAAYERPRVPRRIPPRDASFAPTFSQEVREASPPWTYQEQLTPSQDFVPLDNGWEGMRRRSTAMPCVSPGRYPERVPIQSAIETQPATAAASNPRSEPRLSQMEPLAQLIDALRPDPTGFAGDTIIAMPAGDLPRNDNTTNGTQKLSGAARGVVYAADTLQRYRASEAATVAAPPLEAAIPIAHAAEMRSLQTNAKPRMDLSSMTDDISKSLDNAGMLLHDALGSMSLNANTGPSMDGVKSGFDMNKAFDDLDAGVGKAQSEIDPIKLEASVLRRGLRERQKTRQAREKATDATLATLEQRWEARFADMDGSLSRAERRRTERRTIRTRLDDMHSALQSGRQDEETLTEDLDSVVVDVRETQDLLREGADDMKSTGDDTQKILSESKAWRQKHEELSTTIKSPPLPDSAHLQGSLIERVGAHSAAELRAALAEHGSDHEAYMESAVTTLWTKVSPAVGLARNEAWIKGRDGMQV